MLKPAPDRTLEGQTPTATKGSSNATLGIALLVLAEVVFAGLDTAAKFLGQEMPIPMVVWGRYLFNMILLLALFRGPKLRRALTVTRPWLTTIRGVMLLSMTYVFFTAIQYIPLADAIAIGFVAPLFVVALSIPVLGEKVGPRRWAAVGVGFVGVVVMLRPGFAEVHWAYGLMLLLALMFAAFVLMTRILTRTEESISMLFHGTIVGTIGSSLIVPAFWLTPTPVQWGILAAMGGLGALAHMLLINAYRAGEASILAPFQYSQIVFAAIAGYLVFGEFPDIWVWSGTAILVASGIYIWYRERKA
ncbi:MAG: DMT family transporter [Alphaproteobacteria bacterium]|nr:DMT family transporter [Alphaproteobacteria bacterium]